MNPQLSDYFMKLAVKTKQMLVHGRRELITATGVAILILLLRSLGSLQYLELATLDQFFHLRPYEAPNQRITIVAIDENSLTEEGSWPISDGKLAQLLSNLIHHQPIAIGLDIYRNFPVEPGHKQLVDIYNSTPNLIGIELLTKNKNNQVLPAPELKQQGQVGFNNVIYDPDGKIRRSLLYLHLQNQGYQSFALKLALLYLQSQGIKPQKALTNPEYLQLGKAIFTRFESNHGAYVGADARGYQILSNFPKLQCNNSSLDTCGYDYVSLRDVLDKKVPEKLIRDRIILIGSTAPSLQDFLFIPDSSNFAGVREAKPIAGVKLQAYFIDELISAALLGRPLIKVWNDLLESLWILIWSFFGVLIVAKINNIKSTIFIFIVSSFVLIIGVYIAFLYGWWLPIIPAWLTFFISAMAVIFQISYIQREYGRSKDFLEQVINTIPDPIFVKNEKYEWIILNEAYCRFIGYPYNLLIEKSDYDLFPQQQADIFRQQDNLVFKTHQAHENEEEFTDAYGKTHLIATKRSLHKDAAGNLFLVGVIRDITQRKLVEEKLKRTADDLSRSNQELKIQEGNLRKLVYYDPLTGLSNRKFFHEQLCESINLAQTHNSMFALLFIDLDGFKKVNDTLGHDVGDRLLIIIGQRLTNSLRASDVVSRLGGDEFTVILRFLNNKKLATNIATKILSVITEPIILDDHLTQVSASIGISIYPINGENSEILIKQADQAMYEAKHLGKNRYEFAK